jgi:hypothetical protein
MDPSLDPESLKSAAGWVRDELDPIIAREGPSSLQPDDVLTIHNLLVSIKSAPPAFQVVSFSRIHLAIQAICGKATRWPTKLADEADMAMDAIESRHGPVGKIKFPLFETGGRLWNVCEPQDTTKGASPRRRRNGDADDQALFRRFAGESPDLVDDSRAYKHGSLGFVAGQYVGFSSAQL